MTRAVPLAVYIHWPFCKAKCPYCDFNSHVRESVDHARWKSALLRELEHYKNMLPGRTVTSIFFGGGTPSLMQPDTVEALIAAVQSHWQATNDIEITLEANPTSVEAEALEAFRQAGVNRLSMGVQSFRPKDLEFLGRKHSVSEALRAIETARGLFDRMSFDLIYARPGQTLEQWKAELAEALPYTKGHISLYQLTIEENTPFHLHHAQKRFVLPDDDNAAAMFELTQQMTSDHGLPLYEVSNHAAPGQESRHNLSYWKGDDYLGIGPGAHGRITVRGQEAEPALSGASWGAEDPRTGGIQKLRIATSTLKLPEKWLAQVEEKDHGLTQWEPLTARAECDERILMGLRVKDGISLERFKQQTGTSLLDHINQPALESLIQSGHLALTGDALAVTAQGMLLLNSITNRLIG